MIKLFSKNTPVIWQIDNSYNQPSTSGAVRWDGNQKQFQVCDKDGSWMNIDNNVEITADPRIDLIIEWVDKKMKEEAEIDALMKEYPAVKEAKERLDILIKLVRDNK